MTDRPTWEGQQTCGGLSGLGVDAGVDGPMCALCPRPPTWPHVQPDQPARSPPMCIDHRSPHLLQLQASSKTSAHVAGPASARPTWPELAAQLLPKCVTQCWLRLLLPCDYLSAVRGSPRVWLVTGHVVHLWYVHQLHLHTGQRAAHVTNGGVVIACDGDGAACF